MNEDKFTGKANVYEQYRPSYPDKMIQYLYSNEVGMNEKSVIADIGSGTGILTKLLLDRKSFVYGVEPNRDMKKIAENKLSGYPNYRSVHACAEQTGLDSHSVEFVTAAQAFHWFDKVKFRKECKRILQDEGKVVLIWNSRDLTNDIVIENDKINQKFCPGYHGFSNGLPLETLDFFLKNWTYHEFQNNLVFDEESFIGRNLSSSYALSKNDERFDAYLENLQKLFQKYSKQGIVIIPHTTKSYVGEV